MTRAAPAPKSANASAGAPDTAPELERDRGDGGREPAGELDRGAAVSGGVEHDHVEQGRAGRGKATRQLDRVAGLRRDRVEVPALEANGAAVEHVDGRNDLKDPTHRVTMLTRWH